MKKSKISKHTFNQGEMLSEYDLRAMKGTRGKYYQTMREGYTITVHKKDGTIVVKDVKPKGTVVLEPDVQEYFPDSESVNTALRSLIPSAPKRVAMTREAQSTYALRRVTKLKRANR